MIPRLIGPSVVQAPPAGRGFAADLRAVGTKRILPRPIEFPNLVVLALERQHVDLVGDHVARLEPSKAMPLLRTPSVATLPPVRSQYLSEVDSILLKDRSSTMLWSKEHMWWSNGRIDTALNVDSALSYRRRPYVQARDAGEIGGIELIKVTP